MSDADFPVIVVGAGAAGLLAAIRIAELGHRVLLLEKTPRVGTKILMSGGTRCNLTHDTDVIGMVRAFGKAGKFLRPALMALTPQDVRRAFAAEGVATKVEPGGKVFPTSNRARDVAQALHRRLLRAGGTLALDEPLVSVDREDNGFRLTTRNRTLSTSRLIITTGGKSYPGSGTSGDGYAWLAAWGHSIVPPRPALTPIVSDDAWVRSLQGITLDRVRVALLDPQLAGKRKRLVETCDSFLFTHFGVSGPAVLDVSGTLSGHATPRSLQLRCDFAPDTTEDQLQHWMQDLRDRHGKKQIASSLVEFLPRRMTPVVLQVGTVDESKRVCELTKPEMRAIRTRLKASVVNIAGVRGFQKAEVTAGGVALQEVDPQTMASRVVPHLYLAGEILDVDGPIGGYNFQAAFSTAWLAGTAVARALPDPT